MRLRIAIAALALAGAAVAGYLTWVHYEPSALLCLRGSSSCATVNGSRYAELPGIPVALLGLVTYLVLAASALVDRLTAAAAAAGVALAALVFAAWLVYVQASLLGAWCGWCLASDAILAMLATLCCVRLLRLVPRHEAGVEGLEPPALGFGDRCSTN